MNEKLDNPSLNRRTYLLLQRRMAAILSIASVFLLALILYFVSYTLCTVTMGAGSHGDVARLFSSGWQCKLFLPLAKLEAITTGHDIVIGGSNDSTGEAIEFRLSP